MIIQNPRLNSWNCFLTVLLVSLMACQAPPEPTAPSPTRPTKPYLIVLGVAQDAGYPQAGCNKDCCRSLWHDKAARKMVTCLGLVDPQSRETWLFEASPDFRDQLQLLQTEVGADSNTLPQGIFLSHAHMGHYTGLLHLGREAMGTKELPVWAMPRMKEYLTENGPWNQLVNLKNIQLQSLRADSTIQLNERLRLRPFLVPHRDEFSETAGFKIIGPNASALFIPDIDKWEKWDRDIRKEIANADAAFLDGTFYANGEIPGRDMALIPHPFMEESRTLFASLSAADKQKIFFIHFNHTNPVLQNGAARKSIEAEGMNCSEEGEVFAL